ncbi:MAG: hypothetical protein SGILL_001452 [Bacillariaceae sp.]
MSEDTAEDTAVPMPMDEFVELIDEDNATISKSEAAKAAKEKSLSGAAKATEDKSGERPEDSEKTGATAKKSGEEEESQDGSGGKSEGDAPESQEPTGDPTWDAMVTKPMERRLAFKDPRYSDSDDKFVFGVAYDFGKNFNRRQGKLRGILYHIVLDAGATLVPVDYYCISAAATLHDEHETEGASAAGLPFSNRLKSKLGLNSKLGEPLCPFDLWSLGDFTFKEPPPKKSGEAVTTKDFQQWKIFRQGHVCTVVGIETKSAGGPTDEESLLYKEAKYVLQDAHGHIIIDDDSGDAVKLRYGKMIELRKAYNASTEAADEDKGEVEAEEEEEEKEAQDQKLSALPVLDDSKISSLKERAPPAVKAWLSQQYPKKQEGMNSFDEACARTKERTLQGLFKSLERENPLATDGKTDKYGVVIRGEAPTGAPQWTWPHPDRRGKAWCFVDLVPREDVTHYINEVQKKYRGVDDVEKVFLPEHCSRWVYCHGCKKYDFMQNSDKRNVRERHTHSDLAVRKVESGKLQPRRVQMDDAAIANGAVRTANCPRRTGHRSPSATRRRTSSATGAADAATGAATADGTGTKRSREDRDGDEAFAG